MSREGNVLADRFGEVRRRLSDLEVKAQRLREKLIAQGQPSISGDRYIVTIRATAVREFDMDRLRKRLSEDQLERCLVPVEHTIVTVQERGVDE